MKRVYQGINELEMGGMYYYFHNERGTWHIHISDSRFEPQNLEDRAVQTLDVYPGGFKTLALALHTLMQLPSNLRCLYFEEIHDLHYDTVKAGNFEFIRNLLWSTGVQRYDCSFARQFGPDFREELSEWVFNEVEHVSSCRCYERVVTPSLDSFGDFPNFVAYTPDELKGHLHALANRTDLRSSE